MCISNIFYMINSMFVQVLELFSLSKKVVRFKKGIGFVVTSGHGHH